MMNQQQKLQNDFFRRLIFIAVLVAIGAVIFNQLKFFIGAFLGAATLYMVLRKLVFRMVEGWGWRDWVASLTVVLAITFLLLGLGFLTVELTAPQVSGLRDLNVLEQLKEVESRLNASAGFNLLSDDMISKATAIISGILSSLLNTTYSFVANIFMMMLILFFMFNNGRMMEERFLKYVPLRGIEMDMVREEVRNVVYSNAIGIPLVMLFQALIAWGGYSLMGVSNAGFWAFLTAICGLIPVVGSALIYLPLAVFAILNDALWPGIGILILGLVVISNIDNLIRIIVMKKVADTHPLIVIFGVIMGIPLFGFWGIIFGPLLISGFLLLVQIYYMEYRLITPSVPKRQKIVPRVKLKTKVKTSKTEKNG